MANNQNPEEEPDKKIELDPESIAYMRDVANMSRNQASLEEFARTRPINMRSREDMMSHMMTAHELHPLSLQFYDEGEHDQVPALRNRKRDWSGDTVPALDEQDIRNWHHHEHTSGEYAEDYPHTTMGDEHFHH